MSGHTITAQAHPNIAFIKYWGNTWAKSLSAKILLSKITLAVSSTVCSV